MIIGTGISVWRHLAQRQVDSQTHAERRTVYLPEGPSQRRKLRLDIMITDITPGETLSCKPSRKRGRHGGQHNHHITTTTNGRARKVWIVEVGYCSDTRYLDKLSEKTPQHRQLQSLLMEGFNVTCLPIILGNFGAIYSTTESSLLQLGISHKGCPNLDAQTL